MGNVRASSKLAEGASIVDYNTFSTLSLLRDSIKWFKGHNKEGLFDSAIKVEEGAYQEYLQATRH